MNIDVDDVLSEVIRGALGARSKRHHGAMGYLLGGRGSFLNASTLLGALGVAWGLYETATQSSQGVTVPPSPATAAGAAGVTTPGWPSTAEPPVVPPPIPATPPGATPAAEAGASAPAATVPAATAPAPFDIPAEVQRVIRLTVSAARADGTLSETERTAILDHARKVNAEAVVDAELQRPTSLPQLVAGAPEAARRDLYTLAFAIVRADESVSGAERIYLAQLAHALGLDPATAEALEAEASSRIAGRVSSKQ